MKLCMTLCSGGADSVTLAYYLKALGIDQELISVNYGQRHLKELNSAVNAARVLGAGHTIVEYPDLGNLLGGSALTNNGPDVPHGHYEAESMKTTVVANRNAILISLAAGIGESRGFNMLAYAAHGGDHAIYPDCRPEFVSAIEQTIRLGTGRSNFLLFAPFVHLSKANIISLGSKLGINYSLTWSCYEGGLKHCGKCGTCVERKEAFKLAGLTDPTDYNA